MTVEDAACALVPLDTSVPYVSISLLSPVLGGGTPTSQPDNWHGDVPFVTPPDLNGLDGEAVKSWTRTLTETGAVRGSTRMSAGVLISCRAPIGHVGTVESAISFNQGCKGLPIQNPFDAKYLAYCLVAGREALIALGNGTTFTELSSRALGSFKVPWPRFEVRQQVVEYLDRETAEIDAMDADLDQLVETLRERDAQQHQAAIDTAGHPEVGLALLAEVQLGKMLDQKKVIGEPTEYLRAANITKEGLVSLDDVKVMPMTSSERSKLDLRQGDTLMIEGGDAGRVAFLPEGLPGRAFQKTVLRIRPRSPRIEARYLYLALRQAYRSGRIGLDHSVSTIPHFTAEKAERLLVPLPPLEEQRRIVAELDEQTARIDDMIADAERLKGLLAERRSTLITDVVTGKKEVLA